MRLALQQTIITSWCAHYLQSRKVLVSVVWTTSSVARSHWTRHRPTAAAGRLHTITSRELGPVAHARPPSMAYAPMSPYDRPLPCHQTRAANSSSTLLSFPSDPRSARVETCCGFCQSATPPILPSQLSAHRTQPDCLLPIMMTSSHYVWDSLFFSTQPLSRDSFHCFIPSHACISARYTRLSNNCFLGPNNCPHPIPLLLSSTTPSP